jgi:hypothetical protein
VPTILTTVLRTAAASSSRPAGRLPDQPIDRTFINTWEDRALSTQ